MPAMPERLSDEDLLARLVAFPSVSGGDHRDLTAFVCDYLDHEKIEIRRYAAGDDTRHTLIARIAGSTNASDEGLVLSGHLDVVPAIEPDWQHDPFAMRRHDDILSGRGTCDMKGFVAVAMNTLLRAAAASPINTPLVLCLSADEEVGSLGIQHMISNWDDPFPLPRQVIIGEPTSLRIVQAHKGHLKIRISIAGEAAHSGTPHLGRSAIEPAGRLLVALHEYGRALTETRLPSSTYFAEVPSPVLNVGRIDGGAAVNIIPDACVIDLGVRLLPGQDSEQLAREIRDLIHATCSGDDQVEMEVINDNPPLETSSDAAVVDWLRPHVADITPRGVSFASDGGWLSRRFGSDCVLFGPGNMAVAHRANEHVARAELMRTAEILDDVVRQACGGGINT